MRAEELWLVGAQPWLGALWLSNHAPSWIAVGAAVACVVMSIRIYSARRNAKR